MRAGRFLQATALAAVSLVAGCGCSGAEPVVEAAVSPSAPAVSNSIEPDVFHPARQPGPDGKRPAPPKPAYGGRATIHLERLPRTLNNVLENQGVIRRVMYELHETLLLRDWESMEWRPNLAKEWWVEDGIRTLEPVQGAPPGNWTQRWLDGRISSESPDEIEIVRRLPGSSSTFGDPPPGGHSIEFHESKVVIPRKDVQSLERGTVLTFRLREDVKWHDGHPFDARDVAFSVRLYGNPLVDCGERRPQFAGVISVAVIGSHLVQVWYDTQSYYRLAALGSELTILPAHLYDLSHPDNVDGKKKREADPNWKPTQAEAAEYINKNPHNRDFVGVGPYKLARFDEQGVLVERNPLYYDQANAGYLDSIFWRYVKDDTAAFQALLNGELDFFARMSSDDYFGPATRSEAFTRRNYTGNFYSGSYWFVAWNLRRPQLADLRVREAIARAFDFEGFKTACYKGLADVVTGPWMKNRPEYDPSVKPYPRDPEKARALLEAAGWIDRDGDGVADKDGVKLEIELLSDAGNAISRQFAAKLQEDLRAIAVTVRYTALDSKAVDEKKKQRDFDGVALAWAVGIETDPEQVWHSRGAAADAKSSNFGGFADAEVDRLIEAGQKELDVEKRMTLWRQLHARIYSQQPYLFAYSPPRKFGMNKALYGLQLVAQDPNYVLRRWYYPAGTPGTRATLAK